MTAQKKEIEYIKQYICAKCNSMSHQFVGWLRKDKEVKLLLLCNGCGRMQEILWGELNELKVYKKNSSAYLG